MLYPCLRRYAYPSRRIQLSLNPDSAQPDSVQPSVSQQTPTPYPCSSYHFWKWLACIAESPWIAPLFLERMGRELQLYWDPSMCQTLLGVFLTLSFDYQQPWWGEYTKGRSTEMLPPCLLQVIRMSLCACPLGQESPSAISSLLCWLKASPSWSLLSLLWFRWGSGEWWWQPRKFRGLFFF